MNAWHPTWADVAMFASLTLPAAVVIIVWLVLEYRDRKED